MFLKFIVGYLQGQYPNRLKPEYPVIGEGYADEVNEYIRETQFFRPFWGLPVRADVPETASRQLLLAKQSIRDSLPVSFALHNSPAFSVDIQMPSPWPPAVDPYRLSIGRKGKRYACES